MVEEKEAIKPEASIVFENVRKSFRDGRDPVLKGLNLVMPQGKLTYILGSSGAGKSVMLKHILGLMKPDSGKVWVRGVDVTSLSSKQLIDFRIQFGVLFQNSALFDDLNVFENVAFPLREHTQLTDAEIEKQVIESLEILGLVKDGARTILEKTPSELSGGMKKRVALARAIIRKPEILLYDEPTTGLDPVTRTTVDELIETLKRKLKLTSVVISHDIPSALRLADQIAFLQSGQMIFVGSAAEFLKSSHPEIQSFIRVEKQTLLDMNRLTGGHWSEVSS